MRKLLLSLGCLALVAGLVVAADTVTVVKFDKESKKLTVKDAKDQDAKEKTYLVTDDTKFTSKRGEETKEWKYEDIEKMLTAEPKKGKDGKARTLTFEIETKDGKVVEAKLKMGGKGKGGKKDN